MVASTAKVVQSRNPMRKTRTTTRTVNGPCVARDGPRDTEGALPNDRERPFCAAKTLLERVTGIEPAFSAWEADVLPLNYTRIALNAT